MRHFDDIDGEFEARLRDITTTTRSTVDNSTVTFRTAKIDCEYTPKVIKRLAMGQLVAIPNVQAIGSDESYSLYEIADVYPMHYSMLTLDRSQPAAIRNEFMELIEKEWEKGSKSTWIEIVAAPIGHVMKPTKDGVVFERRAMAPLTGSPVKLLSKESIEQLICYVPEGGDSKDYSLGKLLGFSDGAIDFSVNIEQLIHYMSGVLAFSLDYEEPIVFRRDGQIRIERIGNLVDQFYEDDTKQGPVLDSSFEALSFNPETLNVSWSPIQYVFRHRYDGNLLRFHTQTGRNVSVSPGHSLFVLRNGRIECVSSTEIQVGDYLVSSRNIPVEETSNVKLDLRELSSKECGPGVMLVGLGEDCFGHRDASVPKWKWYLWRSRRNLPIQYWDMLEPAQRNLSRIGYKNCITPLPLTIEVDEEIARILGYYAAEGHTVEEEGENYSVEFTLHRTKDEVIVRDIKAILRSKFGIVPRVRRHGENGLRISVSHRVLPFIFSSLVGRGARNKAVPEQILNSPASVRNAFLRAWIRGDGGTSTSRSFMNGIMFMLLMNDTVATVSEWKGDGTSHIGQRVVRASPRYQMHFPRAREILGGKERSQRGSREPSIPICALHPALRSIVPHIGSKGTQKLNFSRKAFDHTASKIARYNACLGTPAKKTLAEVRIDSSYKAALKAELLSKNSGLLTATERLTTATSQFEATKRLAASSLCFLKVVSIEEVPPTSKYVYDVSVPGNENFMAGFGGIFCHNTGSGKSNLTATVIRKALKAIPDLKVVIFDVSAEYGIHILDVLNSMPSRVLFTDSFGEAKNLPAEYFRRHATPEGLAGREKDFLPKIAKLFDDGKVEFLRSRMVGAEDVARYSTYDGLIEVLTNTLNEKYGTVQQKILVPQVVEKIQAFLRENKIDVETRFDSRTNDLIAKVNPLLADLDNRSQLRKTFDTLSTVVASIPDVEEEEEGYTWGRLADEILSTAKDSPRVFVVNLPEAEDARLETANVISDIFRRRKRSFTLSPRVLFVIDEAQEFIPQAARKEDGTDQSSRAVERLLRHGRKYHLNCWIATQRVAHLNTSALQQLHSYFVSTMPRPYDRQLIADTFAIDDAFMERTLAFQNGDWLLTSFKATATQNIPVFFHAENNEDVLSEYLKKP